MRLLPLLLLAAIAAPRPAAAWSLLGTGRRAPTPRAARLTAGVDAAALEGQLLHLATLSSTPPPSVTRVLFSPADMAARAYVKQLMADAGLAVREDAVGNIIGKWAGTNEERGAVGTGSHIDAIPLAGAYDGTVGVLGAIAAVKSLREARFEPQRAIEVFMTTSEEPTRFGVACLGARVLAGEVTGRDLAALVDANGTTFLEAATAAGYGAPTAAAAVASVRLTPAALTHWVELHIEQAATLEASGASVGVVSSIAAPAPLTITLTGPGGHAGTVLMADRADPLTAAAEIVTAVKEAAAASGSPDTVATVGRLTVSPNAANSIPRVVNLTVDVRDTDGKRRDAVVARVRAAAARAATAAGVAARVDAGPADAPVACDADIVDAARRGAADAGLPPPPDVVSRAYHDSLVMAPYTRAGMIFVRCRAGVSHTPDEYAAPGDVADGVRVLALALADLAGGRLPEDPPAPIARRCPVSGVVSSGTAFRCPVMLWRKNRTGGGEEL